MSFDVENNWLINIAAVIVAIGIVMGTGSMYRYAYSYNLIMAATVMVMAIVVVYRYLIPYSNNRNSAMVVRDNSVYIPGFMVILFIIFYPTLSDIINLVPSYEITFFFLVMVIVSYLLGRSFREKVFNAYLRIIIFLSIVSIGYYFLYFFSKGIPSFLPYWGVVEAREADFYYIWSVYPKTILLIRNQSIFGEPGLFAVHIILAMLLAYKKKNVIFISILIITAVTTFSTSMYLFLILLVMYQFLFSKNRLKYFALFSIAMILLFIILSKIKIFGIPAYWSVINVIREKFTPDSQIYGSFVTRTRYTTEAIKLFMDNLLLGVGHHNTAANIDTNTANLVINTSGFAGLLAELGIFGSFCIFLYIRFFKFFSLLAIPITFIWLNAEFMIYSPLLIFILTHSAEDFSKTLFPLKKKTIRLFSAAIH